MPTAITVSHRLEPAAVFPDPQFHLNVRRVPEHSTMPSQHAHAFNELVIIVKGHGQHAVGPEVYDIRSGDVFVILGETTHGYPATEHLSLINVLFDPVRLGIPVADLGALAGYHALFTIEPRFRRRRRFKNHLRLTVEQLGTAARMVAQIEAELKDTRPGYRFMATTHLMGLMGFLSRCYSQVAGDDARPVTRLSEVLGYMDQHSAEPLTVEDLTRVAHMSQTSLMRTFNQVLGRSPIDYLIRLRVSKAQWLLRRTDMPVTEIAYEVGFGDSNYFARQFRRLTGLSPRAYRGRQTRR